MHRQNFGIFAASRKGIDAIQWEMSMKLIFTLFINFQNVYSHCLVYSALNSSRHHFKASLLDA